MKSSLTSIFTWPESSTRMGRVAVISPANVSLVTKRGWHHPSSYRHASCTKHSTLSHHFCLRATHACHAFDGATHSGVVNVNGRLDKGEREIRSQSEFRMASCASILSHAPRQGLLRGQGQRGHHRRSLVCASLSRSWLRKSLSILKV